MATTVMLLAKKCPTRNYTIPTYLTFTSDCDWVLQYSI